MNYGKEHGIDTMQSKLEELVDRIDLDKTIKS